MNVEYIAFEVLGTLSFVEYTSLKQESHARLVSDVYRDMALPHNYSLRVWAVTTVDMHAMDSIRIHVPSTGAEELNDRITYLARGLQNAPSDESDEGFAFKLPDLAAILCAIEDQDRKSALTHAHWRPNLAVSGDELFALTRHDAQELIQYRIQSTRYENHDSAAWVATYSQAFTVHNQTFNGIQAGTRPYQHARLAIMAAGLQSRKKSERRLPWSTMEPPDVDHRTFDDRRKVEGLPIPDSAGHFAPAL